MSNKRDLLAELNTARDEARLKLHMLSMEARELWGELETKLAALEQQIDRGGEQASEAIQRQLTSLRQAVQSLLSAEGAPAINLSSPVGRIMTRDVRVVSANESLTQAARILWETNCGSAPVVADDGTVIGMLTDRDMCMACYTQGRSLSLVTVQSAMSKRVFACSASDSIERVLELMRMHRVRRLPVTNRDGLLLGIVTLADISRWAHSLLVGRSPVYAALAEALAVISQAPATAASDASAAE